MRAKDIKKIDCKKYEEISDCEKYFWKWTIEERECRYCNIKNRIENILNDLFIIKCILIEKI